MENKINIAEILKDCPSGMELDCTIWDNVVFDHIDTTSNYPIYIKKMGGELEYLTEDGHFNFDCDAKCVIFPKGKTTWEGFIPPCKFKDGDVLATDLGSVFFLNMRLNTDEYYGCYVGVGLGSSFYICVPFAYKECCRLATEEEKQKLFEAIKDNGYKWNAETKTLEKLIEPKFNVGDRIKKHKDYISGIVTNISDDGEYKVEYQGGGVSYINLAYQDDWELAPNKFDINTLKPFDKVLVRDGNKEKWNTCFYGFYDIKYDINYPYECCGNSFAQCIPYEGNEHLLGTTNDCDDFYKTW